MVKAIIKKINVRNPSGFSAVRFNTNPLAKDFVEIIYLRRNRLGKFFKIKRKKLIKFKGKIKRIENNSPRVGFVQITYMKTK